MSSIILVLVGITVLYLGFRFYSKYIGNRIYSVQNDNFPMPSKEFEDGLDYVPTKKHILFGHHFTSIAGAAPIIGPCVAAFWGWLPALLWILLGTVFMGAVHDFGALVTSVKEKGRSIADIASTTISKRVRVMFLIFVILLIWLVLAVFAMAIADLFVSIPSSVIPINIEIIIAIFMGFLLYKKKMDSLIPSLIALSLLYFFVWVGTKTPIDFTTSMAVQDAKNLWIILLFIYSAIASLLPVWTLLQPRDYINSHQLFVGLGLLFMGIFVAQPLVDAPALRSLSEPGVPGLFPLLFVTIACGAISGFHGLVSSGTSSKQLEKLTDARLVGYGGMIGEGTLALASTIAAVAGISLVTQCNLPAVGQVADLNWAVYYDSWAHASGNKATAFVLGGGALLQSLGISEGMANTLMAVLVISFAATTLDTATRIQRFILNEFGSATNLKPLTNRYTATVIAILPAILLAFWNVSDPGTDAVRQAGWVLWPIFGASNQMLAALTLMVLTLYYWQKKKPVLPLLLPMLFIMVVTFTALVANAIKFYGANPILFGLTIILMGLIIWMAVEGVNKVLKIRRRP
ncbi:MAG: carbon starvation protein A [Candidatus Marinimicrobia bacterium]|jgi:carbon starvation protein|nr:carbon starvation protein A [Candidatus Neomarinimicrobiota bacterium]MDP6610869.1 carbon starvation protein A [Candidatus Neomarinimicrobiota bacterium]|tara:strand:+ start:13647 stop:15368 length:1722 start_codon:yes stop_codon:yes gene_type:complete